MAAGQGGAHKPASDRQISGRAGRSRERFRQHHPAVPVVPGVLIEAIDAEVGAQQHAACQQGGCSHPVG